jgi:hypothetical protein
VDPGDLYGLPLEQFTQQRNALAKALRAEGQRDELRKPSAAAWAVNQLVRTQSRELGALFKAGDALQKVQADLLAGHAEPEALRRAVDAERAAVDQLAETARGLLSSNGHELTSATLERVSETLHAAALDDDARASVRGGRLERELRHVGLGAVAAGPTSRQKPRAELVASGRTKRDQKADQRQAARKAEAGARDQWERATASLREAENLRERAAGELREAEQAVRDARRREVEAGREHQRAKRALDRL